MEKNRSSWYITVRKIYINQEKIRFLFTGLINTVIGYLLFILFNFLFFNYIIALCLVYSIAIFFNYYTYKNIVFINKNKSNLFKFVLIYIIFLILNSFLIKIGLTLINNEILLQAFMLPLLAIGLYYCLKKMVF